MRKYIAFATSFALGLVVATATTTVDSATTVSEAEIQIVKQATAQSLADASQLSCQTYVCSVVD